VQKIRGMVVARNRINAYHDLNTASQAPKESGERIKVKNMLEY